MNLEITIKKFKAIALNFSKRKMRNRDEKNLDFSRQQKIFLEKQPPYLDGQKEGVFLELKLPPYLKDMIVKGKININGYFDYDEKDEEIERLVDIDLCKRLGGKNLEDMDPLEFLLTGRLVPKNPLE
jgi:hypothetical protein